MNTAQFAMKKTHLISTLIVFVLFCFNNTFADTLPKKNLKLHPISKTIFIENKGQIKDQNHKMIKEVKFCSKSAFSDVYLLSNGISYIFKEVQNKRENTEDNTTTKIEDQIGKWHRMDLKLVGSNSNCTIIREQKSEYYERYLNTLSENKNEKLYGYEKITYKNVYPNIDWVIYSNNSVNGFKYDFVVHPGGDPKSIKLDFQGENELFLDKQGKLHITNSLANMIEEKPVSFQKNKKIESNFILKNGSVGFEIKKYDTDIDLIIDPALIWSTLYGGSNDDRADDITTDASGNVYIIGFAVASSFPILNLPGAYNDATLAGPTDFYIAKFNSSGVRLWSTYIGGNGTENGGRISCDGSGNLFATGYTSSTDFPTLNPGGGAYFDNTNGGGFDDAVIMRFNVNGALQWSTYYGGDTGDEFTSSIHCDNTSVYLVGNTTATNFPVMNAGGGAYYQGSYNGGALDGYLVKFSTSGIRQHSTYWGTTNIDALTGVYTNGSQVFVCGNSNNDVVVLRFQPTMQSISSNVVGGSGIDGAKRIVADASNKYWVLGMTTSTNFPLVTPPPGSYFQSTNGGSYDVFIRAYNALGTCTASTYFGGSSSDQTIDIDIDANSYLYVFGYTASSNLPTFNPGGGTYFQGTYQGSADHFVLAFDQMLVYKWGTYFGGSDSELPYGGIDLDPNRNIYISADTRSKLNYPLVNPGGGAYFSSTGGGTIAPNYDATVSKFNPFPVAPTAQFSVNSNSICEGSCINFTDQSTNVPTSWSWSFPGGSPSTSTLQNPSVCYTLSGVYNVSLVATNLAGSNTLTQSGYINVNPIPNVTVSPSNTTVCSGSSLNISVNGASNYTWNPGGLTGSMIAVSPTTSITYTINASTAGCTMNAFATVSVTNIPATPVSIIGNSVICSGVPSAVYSVAPVSGATSYSWNLPAGWSGSSITNSISVVPGLTSGIIQVYALNNCGISSVQTKSVTIEAAPNVNATAVPAFSVCLGSTVSLSGTGANTYSWSGGITNGVVFNPTVSASYTVTGTTVNNCSNTAVINLSVNPNPTVSAIPSSTLVCNNGSLVLNGNGALTYTWSNGVTNGVAFTPTSSITYTVNGSNNFGCTSSATVFVNVSATPSLPGLINGPVSICSNINNVTYSVSPVPGASSYSWTLPVGWSGSSSTNSIAAVCGLNGGTISVNATNACGTSPSQTLAINILSIPNISTNVTPLNICSGNTATISASGANTFTWSTGSNSTTIFVNPVATTIYTVSGTNTVNCTSSQTIVLGVYQNPTLSINSNTNLICIGSSATLSVNGANTYTWNQGSNASTIVVSPTITTSYSVTGTNANGCVGTSVYTQSVTVCSFITERNENNSTTKVYPVPFVSELIIEANTNNFHVEVYNSLGEIILSEESFDSKIKLNTQEYLPGIYFVRIGNNNYKILKQN